MSGKTCSGACPPGGVTMYLIAVVGGVGRLRMRGVNDLSTQMYIERYINTRASK